MNEQPEISEQSTWPPALNNSLERDDALSAHDSFLDSLVCMRGPAMSRVGLERALRTRSRLSRFQSKLIVREYCNRNGIFPVRQVAPDWVSYLVRVGAVFIAFLPLLRNNHWVGLRFAKWTDAGIWAIGSQVFFPFDLYEIVTFGILIVTGFLGYLCFQHLGRDAAEARAKLESRRADEWGSADV